MHTNSLRFKMAFMILCKCSTLIKPPNFKSATPSHPEVGSGVKGSPLEKELVTKIKSCFFFLFLTALWPLRGSGDGRFMSLVKR